MYGLYFEKDQAVIGSGLGGHRHDWEHVVVWVQNDQVQYVSTSAHGNFDIQTRDQMRFDGTHPKVVYHKDGIGTHAFRPANSNDEPPENHQGSWQFPAARRLERLPGRAARQVEPGQLRQRRLRPQGRQLQRPPGEGQAGRHPVRPQRLTRKGRGRTGRPARSTAPGPDAVTVIRVFLLRA